MHYSVVHRTGRLQAGLRSGVARLGGADHALGDRLLHNHDTGDPSKFTSSSPPIPALPQSPLLAFRTRFGTGDIVAANGKPVKGVWACRARNGLTSSACTQGPANRGPEWQLCG